MDINCVNVVSFLKASIFVKAFAWIIQQNSFILWAVRFLNSAFDVGLLY